MNHHAPSISRPRERDRCAGLDLLPSEKVTVPRIAEAPAALECRHYMTLEVSRERRLCVGEVDCSRARRHLDPGKMRVDMTIIARSRASTVIITPAVGGISQLVRQSYPDWKAEAAKPFRRQSS